VADRPTAVKWRNWKMHLIRQDRMYDAPEKLPLPRIINLLTDLKEERDVPLHSSWVTYPTMKILRDFEASLEAYPPTSPGRRTLTSRPRRHAAGATRVNHAGGPRVRVLGEGHAFARCET